MAPRTVYANLPDGLQPFTLWDASLADMGSLGVIPCTATGANAIGLIPVGSVNAPNVAIPQALQAFSFVAIGNSSGPVTIQIGTTAALKLYRMDGVTQASTGDIVSTVLYFVAYNAALNGAIGGFQILAPIANEINPIISGATITNSTITTSTYNGNIWTAGTGTLTIAAGKTETFNNTLTFAGTDGTTQTFQASDTIVGRATTDTLTNKTLGAATLSGTLSGGGNQINNVIIGTATPLAGSFTSIGSTTGLSVTNNANATLTGFSATNTDVGASAAVSNSFAVTSAGIFSLAAAGSGSGASAALKWTGSGGFVITQQNAAGNMFFQTGSGPANALIIDASQNITVPGGSLLSTHATAGLGYGAGAGGTVTQGAGSGKATTTALSKASGAITMNNAALAAATIVSFTFTNTAIAATDVLVLNHISGGTPGSYTLNARAAAGSATIDVRNNTAGSLSEAIVIQFVVIKAVNA